MSEIIIKTPEQIQGIRESSRLAANALIHIGQFIRAGMKTKEIDQEVHRYVTERGGTPATLGYCDFPASCCVSINEEVCHGIPNERIVPDNCIVKVDISTILNDYFGDTCATFAIGEISDQAKALIQITKECLFIGIDQVKPGNNFADIGNAIAPFVRSKGFSVVYQLSGHGVGLSLHEAPYVMHVPERNYLSAEVFQPGMTFTIEPMINAGGADVLTVEDKWTVKTKDGSLSAQFEHTVLVTETGVEILTEGTNE